MPLYYIDKEPILFVRMQYSNTQSSSVALKCIRENRKKSVISHLQFCYPVFQFPLNQQFIQQQISFWELEREGPVIQKKK